jgi:ribonucleoside-diphosphate reductase alpha chain
MSADPFEIAPIAKQIWTDKYRFTGSVPGADTVWPADHTVADTWRRVARAAASAEASERLQASWQNQFEEALGAFAFIPGGRIIAGAGTGRSVTLFNCFVLGEIADDLGAIFAANREAALTMQQGGGIGHDFSTLRPRGADLTSTGAKASGPVSFMDVWDSMCATVMSAGARRGAMMATLRCDHPDIIEFIEAKRTPGRLTNFNLSVLVTDAFMAAVRADADWPLVFGGKVFETIKARALWDRIMQSTYAHAEPGVIFIDRVNAQNNLAYCETIKATNPCGEQPLPPYGACLLGAINLTQLVEHPFAEDAHLNVQRLDALVRTAVRFLDNVIDVSRYPLPEQRAEALAKRRIGLGITGLANALAMCGVRYGSAEAARVTGEWLQTLKIAAYETSTDLAREKGAFPACDTDALLASENLRALPRDLRAKIARNGLRNGCLTTIAPTGTISLLAGNVSSGIEPTFSTRYERRVLMPDGSRKTIEVMDFAAAMYRRQFGRDIPAEQLPTVADLTPAEHIRMQAAAQPHIDSAISKTINCPEDIPFEAFESVYLDAYDAGLKGCTTYRPNPTSGAVLVAGEAAESRERSGDITASDGADTPVVGELSNVVYLNADGNSAPAKPAAPKSALVYEIRHGVETSVRVTIVADEAQGRLQPAHVMIQSDHAGEDVWLAGLARLSTALLESGRSLIEVARILSETGPKKWQPETGGGGTARSGEPAGAEIIMGLAQAFKDCAARFAETCDRREHSQPIDAIRHAASPMHERCPNCGENGRISFEGCWMCQSCGTAACG